MGRPLSIEEMKAFASEHYIEIPTKHFLEPSSCFERRLSKWRGQISTWIEQYETLNELYLYNIRRFQEFRVLAEYVGTNFAEYFPFPEIDFDSYDPTAELELAIAEQKDLSSISLYNLFLTSGIRERAIYTYFSQAISHMPAAKNIIVVRSEARSSKNDCQDFPRDSDIKSFEESVAKLQEKPSKYCVYIPYLYDQCIWVAFAPKAFTVLELEELCNTIKLGGDLSQAILEYL